MLASCVNLTLEQFLTVVDCHYLINHYYSSHVRNTKAFEQMLEEHWEELEEEYRERYSTIILIGKRLSKIIGVDSSFFTFHQHHSFKVATIPNPLAEMWWNKELHLKACQEFLTVLLKEQT